MKRAVVVLLLAAGCKSGPSKDDCKQLLDHLVDLEFKKAGAAASSDAMKNAIDKSKTEQSKTQVSSAVNETFMTTCTDKMTSARVTCALAAANLDGVAKCDESK